MNKALIILVLAIVILSLWTFDDSFIVAHTTGAYSASGESAVIVAKADYVSVRAKIFVTPKAGTWANVTFADGTQKQIAWTNVFEVFLPKTGISPGSFGANAPGGIFLNDKTPIVAELFPNTTDAFFTTLTAGSPEHTTVYWLKVEGNAMVTVACYGVGI
jgi:hypothetical protein